MYGKMTRFFIFLSLAILVFSAGYAQDNSTQIAIDKITGTFSTYPVVAIAEYHGLRQAGDFYISLIKDKRFQEIVNDIVVEFASGQSQALLDRYILEGDSIPLDSLRSIWRNTTKVVSWESPIYARWLAAIRETNLRHGRSGRIRVIAGDTWIDWDRTKTPKDWAALGANDVSFANLIVEKVIARHHHALVVLGSNHLAHLGSFRDGRPNTATGVESRFPKSIYVMLMFSGWPGGDSTDSRIAAEHWVVPSVSALKDTWLGAMSVGEGDARTRLDTRADALLYLGSTKSLDEETPLHSELETYDYDELDRRSWIEWGDSTKARRFLNLGKVVEYKIVSKVLGRPRRLWVYTPPGYSLNSAGEYDFLLAFDGGLYLGDIPLPAILDSLIAAKRIRPTVAILLDDSSSTARLADLANHQKFADFIGDELMPWLQKVWKFSSDPHHRIIIGTSAGGLAAAFIALRRPDLFGKVLSQSGAFWRGAEGTNTAPFEWLTGQFAATPKRDIYFFIDVGAKENLGAMQGTAPSILDANRHIHQILLSKGYQVAYQEIPDGGHAPEFWSKRLPVGLIMLSN